MEFPGISFYGSSADTLIRLPWRGILYNGAPGSNETPLRKSLEGLRIPRKMKVAAMSILKDKVAIVTGASRGIGRAIAEVFVREGARVVICGRKQETLDQVAREIGGAVTPVACHVGKTEQIQALVEATTRDFGRIDILVNNAATN